MSLNVPRISVAAILLCLLLALNHSAPVQAAEIIYVDSSATGTNTGDDWSNAFPDLVSALNRAASGDQIWVAAGVYTPGAARGDSFILKNDVSLFGGFNGSESDLSDRNWNANMTVLSGDIDNNDTKDDDGVTLSADDTVGDNSYHIVRATDLNSSAVIDGFTITGGLANGDFPDNQAGGMFNKTSSPTVRNVRFMGNAADDGGAVYNDTDSDTTFTDVIFSGNSAPDGGAVYNWSSKPTFTNVVFANNTSNARDDSTGDGGGLYSFSSELTFENVQFNNNNATNAGGAIFNDTSTFTINNSRFSGNSADFGGGLSNFNDSGGTLENSSFLDNRGISGAAIYNNGGTTDIADSTFTQNIASGSGGGVYNNNESNGNMARLSFNGNSAVKGGAIYNFLSSPVITNNKITANVAESGAGVYNEGGGSPIYINTQITGNRSNNQAGGMGNEGADPILINVTIANNYARVSIGGILNNNGDPQIRNSIIAGNVDNEGLGTGLDTQIRSLNGSMTLVSYSLITGSGGSENWEASTGTDEGGNIDGDPLFVAPADVETTPTDEGNYQLSLGSPAIDAGDNDTYTGDSPTDLAGNGRTNDQSIDMGAFETQQFVLTINIDGNGNVIDGDGLDCSTDCMKTYLSGTEETLIATPADGYLFDGWEGACTGQDSCPITIDSTKSVTATFSLAPIEMRLLQVSKGGSGDGTVTSNPAGINCGLTCSRSYEIGTKIVLTANASAGSTFTGWSGGCSGTATCELTMDEARNVTANFEVQTAGPWLIQVAKLGNGSGTVISSPGSINCGAKCSESFEGNTAVILTAQADDNSTFIGWSGDCRGTGSCLLAITSDKNVSATFASNIIEPGDLDFAIFLPLTLKE